MVQQEINRYRLVGRAWQDVGRRWGWVFTEEEGAGHEDPEDWARRWAEVRIRIIEELPKKLRRRARRPEGRGYDLGVVINPAMAPLHWDIV